MDDIDIASHYNLPSADPEEWPAALDDEDQPGDETLHKRSSSRRYIALERNNSSTRSLNLGSTKSNNGREHLVQKDEPDPLGSRDTVLNILQRRGLSGEVDSRLKNRFMLSSTSFSPALFLSQIHSTASIHSLLDGLNYLSHSIDQKSASLKVLVEANFERFVRAKATIDSVYTEMRNQGTQPDSVPYYRRSAGHFRSHSGNVRSVSPADASATSPKKNALTKESEYGMNGIRIPLMEASVKAEEVWGPALGGREREQMLKSVVDSMEKNRDIYEIGGQLSRSIKQRDYESAFEQYTKARALAKDARNIADTATTSGRPLTDEETHTILSMGRMWLDVDQQVQSFKRDLWRRLTDAPTTSTTVTVSGMVEEHMELISALLELGVEDNPIWVWLLSRYDFLKTKITSFCDRCKVEIEILRRRLAIGEKPTPQTVASYLRSAPLDGPAEVPGRLDTDQVIELWECVHTYLTRLLSSQGGLLGEVLDFWEVAESFINGTKQRILPAGFEGESRKHHQLSPDRVAGLQNGVVDLVTMIRESVLALFADSPVEDAALLSSPVSPPSPNSPISRGITPTESRFKLDPKSIPVPAPKNGEPWEDYVFWPPFANSLSGVHYISKFLVIIGTAASEMGSLRPVSSSDSSHDHLKALVSVARERAVRVVCAVWSKDAEHCKMLEDWTRDPEQRDLTKMPGLFVAFESAILGGLQKILYISEAMAKSDTVDVVTQPPAKMLQTVRSHFVSSVYKALSGLVENAERPSGPEDENEWVLVGPAAAMNDDDAASSVIAVDAVDAKSRVSSTASFRGTSMSLMSMQSVRILLTLSNIKILQADLLPQLVTNFETSFFVKLSEEAKTIRDVLDQIEDRLFQSYIKPILSTLNKEIFNGVTASNWVPSTSRPEQVRAYVYNTMLALVLVHTEISTTIPSSSHSMTHRTSPTTPSPLLNTVLSHLLLQVSSSLLAAFSSRPTYSLAGLMQATLDTEFIAQTMSQYSTDEAANVQSQIYVELDRRTTNDARTRLQAELGEMRGILKRLRERTRGEFACFKKPRSGTGAKAA